MGNLTGARVISKRSCYDLERLWIQSQGKNSRSDVKFVELEMGSVVSFLAGPAVVGNSFRHITCDNSRALEEGDFFT